MGHAEAMLRRARRTSPNGTHSLLRGPTLAFVCVWQRGRDFEKSVARFLARLAIDHTTEAMLKRQRRRQAPGEGGRHLDGVAATPPVVSSIVSSIVSFVMSFR